jgi:phenylalanyl-tRNA synthetase beta chain
MRAPLSWLRDFADFPDDVGLLRSTLDDLGLVVEDVEVVGEGLEDVVVARIDEITAIEGADRVRRVVVNAGAGPLEIVCGATNFAIGDLVPLAPVGAVLPGGFEIGTRKMRGVTSHGMLCSGKELGLGEDHSGLLVLTDREGVSPGDPLVEALGIDADVVFDVTIEGNRPDAHCIAGIARDLAARLQLPYGAPRSVPATVSSTPTAQMATVEIDDEDLCDRFAVAMLADVVVGPSPDVIARRLILAGMRPINNVVDASNYVMLELGQPTHPYDLAAVDGATLRVRRARPSETLVTLDGVERTLGVPGRGLGDTGEDCVICDGSDVVIGIAGIMGGASSEIDERTTSVLLEAASFDPIAITRTSRRLALRTEAAARFSKGSDPALLEAAIDRFATILALSSPSLQLSLPIVVPGAVVAPLVVWVPLSRVNALLGTSFTVDEIVGILAPLGFLIEIEGETLSVHVPTNRPDIRAGDQGIADLTEEVARVFGYSRIPRRAPAWPQPGAASPRQRDRRLLREVLVGAGVSEAWTSSLVAPGELEQLGLDEPEIIVANPLTGDESRLRRSLLPGVVRAVGRNAERRQEDIALFELGMVFVHPSATPTPRIARAGSAGGEEVAVPSEPEQLLVALGRPGDDATSAVGLVSLLCDAFRLERIRLVSLSAGETAAGFHPSRVAAVIDSTTGAVLGHVGEADPELVATIAPGAADRRIGVVQMSLDVLFDPTQAVRRPLAVSAISRYPSSDVDLAFVVADEVPADQLLDAVASGAGDLLEEIRLFDVYRGPGVDEGRRSLAVRVRLCSQDSTLSDAALTDARDAMIAAAVGVGAQLR